MNKYESVIIINPITDEEKINVIVEKITNLINKDGTITKVEKLGLKKLAYEIQKYKEGYYIVFYFEATTKLIQELERYYRITEDIIKFLTIRTEA